MPKAIFIIALVLTFASQAAAQSYQRVAVSDGRFERLHDIVLSPDKRFLYLADLGNNEVKVLDPMSLRVLGRIGDGQLRSPHDVAFDRSGRRLVADSGNDRVAVFQVDGVEGRLIASWSGKIRSPEGVAELPSGDVAVTDTGCDGIAIFRAGKNVAYFDRPAGDSRRFASPHDIMTDHSGRIIVADSGNHRLLLMTLSDALRVVQTIEGKPYKLNEPKYLAIDAEKRLYVADEYNDRVLILDRRWQIVGQIGSGRKGRGKDQLNHPEGVAVDGDRIWIVDTYNNRVLRYRR